MTPPGAARRPSRGFLRLAPALGPWFFPVLLVLLVAGLFGGFLFDASHVVSGSHGLIAERFLFLRSFTAREILNGNFPLWNPMLFSGTPLLGDPESALLYPPNLLFLILPASLAMNWLIALHVALLGLGCYYWLVGAGHSRPTAFLAAVAGLAGGAIFPEIRSGHLPTICALAWFPWVFLGVNRWVRKEDAAGILLAAASLALQAYAGDMVLFLITAAAGVLYGLGLVRASGADLRTAAPGICALIPAAVVFASAQILPTLHTLAEAAPSTRHFRPLTWVWAGLAAQEPPREAFLVGTGAVVLIVVGGLSRQRAAFALLVAAAFVAWWGGPAVAGEGSRALPGISFENFSARVASVIVLLLLPFLADGLRILLFGGPGKRLAAAVLVLAVIGESLAGAAGMRDNFPTASAARTTLGDGLRRLPGDFRILTLPNPNAPMDLMREGIWGTGPLRLRRYQAVVAAATGSQTGEPLFPAEPTAPAPPGLNMFRYLLTTSSEASESSLLVNGAPLPRFFVTADYEIAQAAGILSHLTDSTWQPGQKILLESEPIPRPTGGPVKSQIRLLEATANGYELEIMTDKESLLVVTDSYSKDWQVEPHPDNAQLSYRLQPGNVALRVVPLLAGHHRFRLLYRPGGLTVGLTVTLAGILAAGGFLFRRPLLRLIGFAEEGS